MKKDRSMDDYLRAGAWMRLLKAVFAKTYVECSKVMRVSEYEDKLRSAEKKILSVCSQAEDNMFADFPKLDSDYTDAFYGSPSINRSKVDEEQIERMTNYIIELFGKNWRTK